MNAEQMRTESKDEEKDQELDDSRGVIKLFQCLTIALKTNTADELSEAIILYTNNKKEKSDEVDYIMNLVATHYGISVKSLKKKHARGKIQDAKHITYCLLHFTLGLTARDISRRVFYNWNTSVSNGIKRLKNADVDIEADREFISQYKRLHEKFVKNQIVKKAVNE